MKQRQELSSNVRFLSEERNSSGAALSLPNMNNGFDMSSFFPPSQHPLPSFYPFHPSHCILHFQWNFQVETQRDVNMQVTEHRLEYFTLFTALHFNQMHT